MAYEIVLFCRATGLDASQAIRMLLSEEGVVDTGAITGDWRSGVGWESCQLTTSGSYSGEEYGGFLLEVCTDSVRVQRQIASVDPQGKHGIGASNLFATITLWGQGEPDWKLVRRVWKAASKLWPPCVPCDDVGGFETDFEALPD
jgi:hypothetical protein